MRPGTAGGPEATTGPAAAITPGAAGGAAAGAAGQAGAGAGAAIRPGPAAVPGFNLRALFAPRSVAVVGASPRSDLARTVRDNIARVGGSAPCHFVNPRYDEVDGTRCHPNLASLPEIPDIVVLAVNPLRAAQFTREAAAAGAPSVVIPGGGVVEGGEAAARMQAEVAEIAIATGTAILGPNCMGVIDLTTRSAAYIGDIAPSLRRGGVAGIAQSGSVADAFVQAGPRIGWSRIISCGSEVVLDLCDYLAYCVDDPETNAIVLFIEGIKRPERFIALADRALAMNKPILAVKVGRSRQAQDAALAHSGSMVGEDRAWHAAFRAAGVVRFDDLDEVLEAAALVTGSRRLGRGVGRGRTGAITVSTGEGSLIADLGARTGLDLPTLPAVTRDRIADALPTLGYIGNPMDPWGADDSTPAYRACLEAFAATDAFDVLAVVHDFPYRSQAGQVELATELAGLLVAATADQPAILPVFVSLTSGDATPEIQQILDAAGGIPLLRGAVEAFGSIARLAWWEGRHAARLNAGPVRVTWPALAEDHTAFGHDRPAGSATGLAAGSAAASAAGPAGSASGAAGPPPEVARLTRLIPERESLELLRAAGVPVTQSAAAVDAAGAATAASAAALAWPLVVKLDSTDSAHKSDIGGVVVGIVDDAGLVTAVERVLAAGHRAGRDVRGVLIQPEAPPGVELLVGARRDPQLGPLVVVGIGGVLTEILDDVAVRLAPVTDADALAMLGELRGARLLDGVRGRQPADRAAAAAVIVSVARALESHPEWQTIELNPVVVGPGGAVAVDALILAYEGAEATDA